jgi:hypothetical protein
VPHRVVVVEQCHTVVVVVSEWHRVVVAVNHKVQVGTWCYTALVVVAILRTAAQALDARRDSVSSSNGQSLDAHPLAQCP